MVFQNILRPKAILTRQEVAHGLRALIWEGIASTGFASLTASAFLVAFALALGANNLQIGILAGLPFITDLLQIPAVWVIEKIRHRKALVLATWLFSQLLWIPVALIPFIMVIPGAGAVSLLLVIMAVRSIINAFTNCGWNSWIRDLIPEKILGRFLARRESVSAALAVVLGFSAGYFLDYWNASYGGALGYSLVFLFGLVFFGLVSPAMMSFIPEPAMPVCNNRPASFIKTVIMPFKEKNYRRFMKFLLLWGFASNLAIPFFAVFMIHFLKLSIFTVIVLTMLSEVFTVISLRHWGPLADRFGSKTILYISSFMFLLTLIGWMATALHGANAFLLPLLDILNVFTGIAVAGITLATGALSFKLAPQGQSTSYLAGASLAESAGIGLGALVAGFIADLFTGNKFSLSLTGIGWGISGFTVYHLLFALAFIIGIFTLKTLHKVQEAGSVRREAVLPALLADVSFLFRRLFKHCRSFITFTEVIRLGKITGPRCITGTGNLCIKTVVPALLRNNTRKPPPCGMKLAFSPVRV